MINKYRKLNNDLCSQIDALKLEDQDLEVQEFLQQNKEMTSIKNIAKLQKSLLAE